MAELGPPDREEIARWPLVLGVIIVLLVLVFPQGVVGFAQARLARRTA